MSLRAYLHVLDVTVGPEGDGVAQHRPGVTVSAHTGPHQKSAHRVVHQPKYGLRHVSIQKVPGSKLSAVYALKAIFEVFATTALRASAARSGSKGTL